MVWRHVNESYLYGEMSLAHHLYAYKHNHILLYHTCSGLNSLWQLVKMIFIQWFYFVCYYKRFVSKDFPTSLLWRNFFLLKHLYFVHSRLILLMAKYIQSNMFAWKICAHWMHICIWNGEENRVKDGVWKQNRKNDRISEKKKLRA